MSKKPRRQAGATEGIKPHSVLSPRSMERVSIARTLAFEKIAHSMIKFGGFAFVAVQIRIGVQHLAGKTTEANFAAFATANVNEWVAWIVAVSCGFGWHRERSMRKRKTAALSDMNKEMELRIDPGRSSSKLPPSGDTREGD